MQPKTAKRRSAFRRANRAMPRRRIDINVEAIDYKNPDLLKKFVATNAVAGFFDDGDHSGLGQLGQKALARFVRTEQGLDSCEQGSVFAARTR